MRDHLCLRSLEVPRAVRLPGYGRCPAPLATFVGLVTHVREGSSAAAASPVRETRGTSVMACVRLKGPRGRAFHLNLFAPRDGNGADDLEALGLCVGSVIIVVNAPSVRAPGMWGPEEGLAVAGGHVSIDMFCAHGTAAIGWAPLGAGDRPIAGRKTAAGSSLAEPSFTFPPLGAAGALGGGAYDDELELLVAGARGGGMTPAWHGTEVSRCLAPPAPPALASPGRGRAGAPAARPLVAAAALPRVPPVPAPVRGASQLAAVDAGGALGGSRPPGQNARAAQPASPLAASPAAAGRWQLPRYDTDSDATDDGDDVSASRETPSPRRSAAPLAATPGSYPPHVAHAVACAGRARDLAPVLPVSPIQESPASDGGPPWRRVRRGRGVAGDRATAQANKRQRR